MTTLFATSEIVYYNENVKFHNITLITGFLFGFLNYSTVYCTYNKIESVIHQLRVCKMLVTNE